MNEQAFARAAVIEAARILSKLDGSLSHAKDLNEREAAVLGDLRRSLEHLRTALRNQ